MGSWVLTFATVTLIKLQIFWIKYENGTFTPPILFCLFIEPEFFHFTKKRDRIF